jgi:hypothetical protein
VCTALVTGVAVAPGTRLIRKLPHYRETKTLDSCADHPYIKSRAGGWRRRQSAASTEEEIRMKKKSKKDDKKAPKKGK